MAPINFNYWLQGSLELGTIKALKKNQVKMIKEHIKLVESKSYFVSWIEGFIYDKDSLNEVQINIIKEKLQNEFITVTPFIDMNPTKSFERLDLGKHSIIC